MAGYDLGCQSFAASSQVTTPYVSSGTGTVEFGSDVALGSYDAQARAVNASSWVITQSVLAQANSSTGVEIDEYGITGYDNFNAGSASSKPGIYGGSSAEAGRPHLYLRPGWQEPKITIASYAQCATDTLNVYLATPATTGTDSTKGYTQVSIATLTEGTGWARGASNAEACASLASALVTSLSAYDITVVSTRCAADGIIDFLVGRGVASFYARTSDTNCLAISIVQGSVVVPASIPVGEHTITGAQGGLTFASMQASYSAYSGIVRSYNGLYQIGSNFYVQDEMYAENGILALRTPKSGWVGMETPTLSRVVRMTLTTSFSLSPSRGRLWMSWSACSTVYGVLGWFMIASSARAAPGIESARLASG
jgi:hypothetical protein